MCTDTDYIWQRLYMHGSIPLLFQMWQYSGFNIGNVNIILYMDISD